MTAAEALAYQSPTMLGNQISALQQMYTQGQGMGVPPTFLTGLLTSIGNLIVLNEQYIAYDAQVADFQARCTAMVKAGGGSSAAPNPVVIGLGSATVGGILGFVAARILQKKPDGENPTEADEETDE